MRALINVSLIFLLFVGRSKAVNIGEVHPGEPGGDLLLVVHGLRHLISESRIWIALDVEVQSIFFKLLLHFVHIESEGEEERGSFPRGGDEIQVALEIHHDLFGDEKAEAHLAALAHYHLRILVLGNLTQNLENGILVLLLDALALVVHNEYYFVFLSVVLHMDVYPIALLGAVDRVLNYIVGNLLQPIRVPNHVPRQVLVFFLILQVFVHQRVTLKAGVLLVNAL